MPARIDPFVEVLLRERGDQLYLLPGEPVTMIKGGQPRKVSRQPLTAAHIYALLVEVAPAEAIDFIDQMRETEFDYETARGQVRVHITPESGRLTAVIAPLVGRTGAPARPPAEPPRPPRPSVIAAAPMVKTPVETAPLPASAPAPAPAPAARPAEVASPEDQLAERRLGALLKDLVQSGASDLHLRAGEPPVVRLRGELERRSESPFAALQLELLLRSMMPEQNQAEWREAGYTHFAYEIAGSARFRVMAARDRKGPVGVFRVIPAQVPTVEQLGLPKSVQQLCVLPKGLVLVTGPSASGKSTTLGALIDLINRTRAAHIVTIEDPIEFVLANEQGLVTQCQVKLHTGSFAAALRATRREDPDVVLVAELPDLETMAAALEAADAGRLVFGAMPTATATATVDRMLDWFPPDRQAQIRALLAETLKGVIAQTLCKTTAGELVAAREILLATPALANLIRDGKTAQIPSIIQTGRKLGMIGLNDALLQLVEQKTVSPDEAYAKAVDKAGLGSQFKARGITFTAAAE